VPDYAHHAFNDIIPVAIKFVTNDTLRLTVWDAAIIAGNDGISSGVKETTRIPTTMNALTYSLSVYVCIK
jgi:hypothetical protein